MTQQQPTFFIPHGGGPCFFMDDPLGTWSKMEAFLSGLPARLPERPKAILLISAHWETDGFALTGERAPGLIYDYYGFPAHTYQLQYPAAGAPEIANEARHLLHAASFPVRIDPDRGFDHGVFVPLKVAFPDADIPVVEMSVERGLDPALHLAAGKALAPLRDQGVLIIASGMSFHNLRSFNDPAISTPSANFNDWLAESIMLARKGRASRLEGWLDAPSARLCHPQAEHLLPLMVAAGAAEAGGLCIYQDRLRHAAVSAFQFN